MNGKGLPPVKRWRVTITLDVHDGSHLFDELASMTQGAIDMKYDQQDVEPPSHLVTGSFTLKSEENKGHVSRETYPDELAEWWANSRKPGQL